MSISRNKFRNVPGIVALTASVPTMLGRRRILGTTLGAVTAVCLATASAAHATPIKYVFEPGASTVLAGDLLTITGSFTFDLEGLIESDVKITMTGTGPYARVYEPPEWFEINPTYTHGIRMGFASNPAIVIQWTFEEELGSVLRDELSFVKVYYPDPADDVVSTGAVGFVTAVPEPASVALLGTGFGLLLLRGRANRRGRAQYPS